MPRLPRVLELLERAPETLEPSLFFQRLIDDRDQLCDVERPEQIAGCAVPKPIHRGFQAPVAGDDDDLHLFVIALDFLQELRSLLAWELEVQRHQIDRLFLQEVGGGLCAVHRMQIVEGAEDQFERFARTGFVLHDQDGRPGRVSLAGSLVALVGYVELGSLYRHLCLLPRRKLVLTVFSSNCHALHEPGSALPNTLKTYAPCHSGDSLHCDNLQTVMFLSLIECGAHCILGLTIQENFVRCGFASSRFMPMSYLWERARLASPGF